MEHPKEKNTISMSWSIGNALMYKQYSNYVSKVKLTKIPHPPSDFDVDSSLPKCWISTSFKRTSLEARNIITSTTDLVSSGYAHNRFVRGVECRV